MDDPIAQFFASPRTDNHSASVVQIESGKLVPLIIVLAIFCGLSIAVSVFTLWHAQIAERENRLLEYYVMELDGKLMSKGVIEPSRSWSAQKQERQSQ